MSTAEREDAIRELRKIAKPGSTLRTILRHVSRSGMSRSVSVVKCDGGEVRELDYLIARAMGEKIDPRNGGIKVAGCGFDAGFDVVYNLGRTLYGSEGRSYACLGDRCPSNSHVNDRNAPRGKGVRHTDGYALGQRWL